MGYGVWGMGYGVWDRGYGIWDMGYGIWDGQRISGLAQGYRAASPPSAGTLLLRGLAAEGAHLSAPCAARVRSSLPEKEQVARKSGGANHWSEAREMRVRCG